MVSGSIRGWETWLDGEEKGSMMSRALAGGGVDIDEDGGALGFCIGERQRSRISLCEDAFVFLTCALFIIGWNYNLLERIDTYSIFVNKKRFTHEQLDLQVANCVIQRDTCSHMDLV